MKYITLIFLLVISSCGFSQPDFTAYNNISNPDFQAFVNLFPEQQLPITAESLRGTGLLEPSLAKISNNFEESYLKLNGTYIAPKLYTYVGEADTTDMYESFYPAFKLPTTGNYILLIVYQWGGTSEWMYRAQVLSYDLAGNFIKAVGPGYLIDGAAPYVSVSINQQMQLEHTYITNASSNRSDFFQCKPCDKSYKTDTYQIQTNGQDNLVSSVDNGTASFKYVPFYFKPVE